MKNKNKLLILLPLFLVASFVKGQDESLFSRINGIKFKEKIFLKWDDTRKSFFYAYDYIDSWHTIDDNIYFQVKNDDKNNFKIYFEFYNPLRYSIKSEDKDFDDPAYQALLDFFSKLPTLPNSQLVESDKLEAVFGSSLSNKNDADPNPEPGQNPEPDIDADTKIILKQSILLHEWLYQLGQSIDTIKAKDDPKGYEGMINSINELEAAENYLFGKIGISIASNPESSQAFTINEWVKGRSDALYDSDNDYDKFKSAYCVSVEVLKGLKTSKENAQRSLNALTILLSSGFDAKISDFIMKEKLEDFKKYSNSTSVWLSMNHIDRFDANNKVYDKFESFLNKIDQHIRKFTDQTCNSKKTPTCLQYKEDYDVKLGWSVQKMKSYKYEVKKIDKEGLEIAKSNSTGEFVVAKKIALYPFVSSGVLYSGFSYPNYTVSSINGLNTVGQTSDTKVYVRPALFLNFLIASWEPVYPFLQLGVISGDNDALFPVGLGLSLGKSFSISGGAMLGYRKDLGSLSVGQTIKDETELKNDLVYKGFASWYFSINYNLGKK